jgi:hypothetical protein
MLYVVFLHPLVFEAALCFSRIVTRSISEHHEAAGWVICVIAVANKHVHSRLIIALIQDPWMASLATLDFFVQLPLQACAERLDRVIYRSVHWYNFGRHGIEWTSKDDPSTLPRNVTLTVRVSHIETCCEMMCSMLAISFVLVFGISLNQRDPPSTGQVLLNFIIQVLVQSLNCLACTLWLVVVERRPALSVPLLRIRGFTLMLGAVALWCSVHVVWAGNHSLGRMSGSRANWVFLTKGVLTQLDDAHVICARFPEASSFAATYCGG